MYNTKLISIVGLFIIGIVVLGMWGCPTYDVWNSEMQGKALLAHAKYSREVAVAEARAKKESATLLAESDTIRAHGTAISNRIIANSITDGYLHWMFYDELSKTQNQIIYLPTEAGMPINEANRFNKQTQNQQP
jgi:hypothetical protein